MINWFGKSMCEWYLDKLLLDLRATIKVRKILQNESLKCLCHSFTYLHSIYSKHVWRYIRKKTIQPLSSYHTKKGTKNYLFHHQSHCFVNWHFKISDIFLNILLVALCREIIMGSTFWFLFTKNSDVHVHDTRQKSHYQIPLCISILETVVYDIVDAFLWNTVINIDINPNVSHCIFLRNLNTEICCTPVEINEVYETRSPYIKYHFHLSHNMGYSHTCMWMLINVIDWLTMYTMELLCWEIRKLLWNGIQQMLYAAKK